MVWYSSSVLEDPNDSPTKQITKNNDLSSTVTGTKLTLLNASFFASCDYFIYSYANVLFYELVIITINYNKNVIALL